MDTMFLDDRHIVDTAYLVAAFTWDGVGPQDGQYNIGVLLSLGEHVERLSLEYPTAHARDTALQELARVVRAQMAVDEED